MEKYKKLAGEITDALNPFGFDQQAFNQAMSTEHRTLQQNFTRMCLGWIEHCASEEYRTDLRNEGSAEISKKLINLYKEEMANKGFTGVTLELMSKPSKYLVTV